MNCPLTEKGCGGCAGLKRPYGDLLREKNAAFQQLFPGALPIVGVEDPRFYRNKVLRSFANGKTSLYHGMYRAGTHQIVSVQRCMLENERATAIANTALELLAERQLPAYREDFHRGVLRHMQVRRAPGSGEALVTVITGGKDFPGGQAFADRLMLHCRDVRGVIHNVNPRGDSAVMGYHSRVLSGQDEIWDRMSGLMVCLTSRSFYQVNTAQAEKLYARAIEFASLTKADTVLDAYCGVGIIGMLAARQAGRVTGIEIVPDAIACARKAARRNHIENIDFLCGDAGRALSKQQLSPSVVFMDPPRTGCSADFLRSVAACRPERIVYVSCNPETLRRDADLLAASGYRMDKVQPYDLFPFTGHTEAVALLRRETAAHNMKLDPEPFEMIKSGQKTIELRLFDEKRRKIKAGDEITFTNNATGEQLRAAVVKMHRFPDFEALYQALPLMKCGYTEQTVAEAKPSDMERYYALDAQKKYGVVGIELIRK